MLTFLIIITTVLFLLLVTVTAMQPEPSPFSLPELERRAKHSTPARAQLHRQVALPDVRTLLRIKQALLLVAVILLSVVTFGWVIGVILAVFVTLLYPVLARTKPFRRFAQYLYRNTESLMLRFVERFSGVFAFLRDTPLSHTQTVRQFGSRHELRELIEVSKEALTADERLLLASALDFPEKTIGSVMTPRAVIDTIKKTEFLGPLVLDELHALGHSRLPVIDEDLNHVVGILYLRDLLSLDIKRSTTAEKAMEKKVFYIHQDESLQHALAAFLKVRHHLFIVINDERETVGLITLEDVIEQLLGRRIVDEDDIHDDLRSVARREGRKNNRSSAGVGL